MNLLISFRHRYFRLLVALAGLLGAADLAAAGGEPVRIGVLSFGTVNWALDVVREHGLAEREGVEMQVVPLGSKNASNVAIQGGAVDVVVGDWIWVSRRRTDGARYTLFPYSVAVGALMTRPEENINTLADLRGKRLGVAGGPVDKSWLLLRAFARKTLGQDLNDAVEPSYAAPPLLNQLMLRGDLPAVLNFWHYGARLKAAGMRPLLQITEVLDGLGVEGALPLIGWVFDEEWANEHRAAVSGFLRASLAAQQIMLESDQEWQRLRPMMKVEDDRTFIALRDSYRAGIPRGYSKADIDTAGRVFGILAAEGGEELVGGGKRLAPGTFWEDFEIGPWPR